MASMFEGGAVSSRPSETAFLCLALLVILNEP
jgi:hypothetical protein